MKCTVELVGIALACLAIQPSAQAEASPAKVSLLPTERVTFADLDLTRADDAQILVGRIKDAAYRVCGGDPRSHVAYDLMPARVEWTHKECRDGAMARAVATIDMPQVAASSR